MTKKIDQDQKALADLITPGLSVEPLESEVHYRIRPSGIPELAIPLPQRLNLERLSLVASRTDPDRLIERLWAAVVVS